MLTGSVYTLSNVTPPKKNTFVIHGVLLTGTTYILFLDSNIFRYDIYIYLHKFPRKQYTYINLLHESVGGLLAYMPANFYERAVFF